MLFKPVRTGAYRRSYPWVDKSYTIPPQPGYISNLIFPIFRVVTISRWLQALASARVWGGCTTVQSFLHDYGKTTPFIEVSPGEISGFYADVIWFYPILQIPSTLGGSIRRFSLKKQSLRAQWILSPSMGDSTPGAVPLIFRLCGVVYHH